MTATDARRPYAPSHVTAGGGIDPAAECTCERPYIIMSRACPCPCHDAPRHAPQPPAPPYYWTPDARHGVAHAYPGAWTAPNTIAPRGPLTRALCGRRPTNWPAPSAYSSALLCRNCLRVERRSRRP